MPKEINYKTHQSWCFKITLKSCWVIIAIPLIWVARNELGSPGKKRIVRKKWEKLDIIRVTQLLVNQYIYLQVVAFNRHFWKWHTFNWQIVVWWQEQLFISYSNENNCLFIEHSIGLHQISAINQCAWLRAWLKHNKVNNISF